eukprot:6247736-Ditylum_brightwellii.AAC.1
MNACQCDANSAIKSIDDLKNDLEITGTILFFLCNASDSDTSSQIDIIDSGSNINFDGSGKVEANDNNGSNGENMEMDIIDSSSIGTTVDSNDNSNSSDIDARKIDNNSEDKYIINTEAGKKAA